mgnify:CR=1 FL=1
MKVLIIDNYDSFTYNLYQLAGAILARLPVVPAHAGQAGAGKPFAIDVRRNDAITISQVKEARYDRIIISPGPGEPSNPAYFGVSADILTDIGRTTPVLGVCLGMQGMGHYFGGKVVRAKRLMHGKTSFIRHDGKGVFAGLPQHLEVMRYHSLVVERESLPAALIVTAEAEGNEGDRDIMGLRHAEYPIEGIQFHPESFATEGGKQILSNFLFNQKS